jgi:hypothetical protein
VLGNAILERGLPGRTASWRGRERPGGGLVAVWWRHGGAPMKWGQVTAAQALLVKGLSIGFPA